MRLYYNNTGIKIKKTVCVLEYSRKNITELVISQQVRGKQSKLTTAPVMSAPTRASGTVCAEILRTDHLWAFPSTHFPASCQRLPICIQAWQCWSSPLYNHSPPESNQKWSLEAFQSHTDTCARQQAFTHRILKYTPLSYTIAPLPRAYHLPGSPTPSWLQSHSLRRKVCLSVPQYEKIHATYAALMNLQFNYSKRHVFWVSCCYLFIVFSSENHKYH